MRNFYEELEKLLKSSQLTREQKIQIIKEAGEAYNKQIDNELNNYLAKQYIGAALEIGSGAIPVGGVAGQIAKRTIPAAITKTAGRKFTQDIAASAIGGGINSSVYGIGRGLMEDKNPLTTALQDGATGLGTGAALGGITGKIASEARIIKNDNHINGFKRDPIRQVVINPKINIDKKFINIIIQSLCILFLEIILILKAIICVTIQVGNINKTTTFTI